MPAPSLRIAKNSSSHSELSAYKHVPRVPSSAVLEMNDPADENDGMGSLPKQPLSSGSSRRVQAKIPSEYLGYDCDHSPVLQDYRLEQFSKAQTVAHVANALARVSHENLVDIFGMGDDFVVTTPWDETLRTRLHRLHQQEDPPTRRSSNHRPRRKTFSWWKPPRASKGHSKSPSPAALPPPPTPLDLWQEVALPITRALLYLHSHQMTLGGGLTLDGIVLREQPLPRRITTQVYLKDFTRAIALADFCPVNQEAATEAKALIQHEQAVDIYQLGLVWNELAGYQPLPPGGPSGAMDQIIGACCHPEASARPSIRRAHKRLLEVLRFLIVQPDPKGPPSIPLLHGLGDTTTTPPTKATSLVGKSTLRSKSSQCPTEVSTFSEGSSLLVTRMGITPSISRPPCSNPWMEDTELSSIDHDDNNDSLTRFEC